MRVALARLVEDLGGLGQYIVYREVEELTRFIKRPSFLHGDGYRRLYYLSVSNWVTFCLGSRCLPSLGEFGGVSFMLIIDFGGVLP